jgi:hypothetical protein
MVFICMHERKICLRIDLQKIPTFLVEVVFNLIYNI